MARLIWLAVAAATVGVYAAAEEGCVTSFCDAEPAANQARCCQEDLCPASGEKRWKSACHAFCSGVLQTIECPVTTTAPPTTTTEEPATTTAEPTEEPTTSAEPTTTTVEATTPAPNYFTLVDPTAQQSFDGASSVRLDGVPAFGSEFSIAMIVTQDEGNTGYVLSKSSGDNHDRVFTLLFSSRGSILIAYDSAKSKDAQSVRFNPTNVKIADGKPHRVLLTVKGNQARITIDDFAPIAAPMDGINDCGESNDGGCAFVMGQRLSASDKYAFEGSVLGARFYANEALDAFPKDLVVVVVTTLEATARPTAKRTAAPKTTQSSSAALAKCDAGTFRSSDGNCQSHNECKKECGPGCADVSKCPSNCNTCLLDESSAFCLVCAHGKYLHNGECHTDCNSFGGTTPTGDELTGRECASKDSAAAPRVEYEAKAPTSTTDRVCNEVSACGSGNWLRKAASATSDVQCITCPSGYSDHDSDPSSPCERCKAGQYSPAESTGVCAAKTVEIGRAHV